VKKVLIVFGTRPEAIKMAPLVKQLQKRKESFNIKVCVTAQHREMLDQVLDLFNIKPDYDLDIMRSDQNLYEVSSNILLGMKDVLENFKPNIVLVHGDTTTTAMVSLATFYQKIKIGHVEAGLRTNNLYSPWPEEANRQMASIFANFHFTPTQATKKNLLKENKKERNIIVTGNTVIDALFLTLDTIKNNKKVELDIIQNLSTFKFRIIEDRKIILVTGHRRENHGLKFLNICEALKEIALKNKNVDIVYPVHLNPNVQKPVYEMLSDIENIYLIEPLQYKEFVYLMDKSYFIITDSGGIQEEAPSLGKPVLLLRDTTERPEAIKAGTVKLVGTDKEKIISEAQWLLDCKEEYDKMSQSHNPYGDGNASKKIVEFLVEKKDL